MTDQERVPILLTREQWQEAHRALAVYADIIGRNGSIENYRRTVDMRLPLDHQVRVVRDAIAAQLRAPRGDAGEGE